ncbi:trehalose-phosphatase [Cellulosimicrobium cellulans]|uniref:Trehalose-phosphate phosphatase n=1 Tax=Cellulosimicrobium cellulans TaxID=1710 RepID=A0ABX5XGD2_CELCE|nr:trehalose-phosphatase [Cellulosimicrobium cellulans]
MVRRARPGERAVRRRRDAPRARDALGRRDRAVLRGLLERHALAALPRRHLAAHVPPHVVGRVPPRQPALRRRRRRAGGAGRRRLGARLPAPARAADDPRPAPGRADRVLQPHPVPPARAVPAAAVAPSGDRRPAGRGPRGLPARGRRRELHPCGAAAARPHHARADHHGPGRGRARPPRPRRRVPHLDRLAPVRRARPHARGPAALARDPRGPGRPGHHDARRRPPRLHQGHPAPHQGVRRAAAGRPPRRRARHARPGREPEPRERRRLPGAARARRGRGGPHQRRVRGDRARRDPLPAPLLPARGDGRPVPRGRRHARHGAARRHEPRREGVRRGPLRRPRGARALRVHRCRRRALVRRAPRQPARHRRDEGHHRRGRAHGPPRAAQAHAPAAPQGPHRRRRALVGVVPRRPHRDAVSRAAPPPGGRRAGCAAGRPRGRRPARGAGRVTATHHPAPVPEPVADAVRAFAADADGAPAARLVALDFDGTLSPLVDDPLTARMAPSARAAVDRLAAALVGTTTRLALVSGRNLADLAERSEPPVGTYLVGSHGAETGHVTEDGLDAVPLDLTPEQADHLAALRTGMAEAVAGREGAWVQEKPSAAVLHTRLASAADTQAAEHLADAVAARLGLHAMHGKDVVEVAVVETSKGEAVDRLRDVVGQDAGCPDARTRVLYAGDDTTDETAFAVLGPGDLGVKVGDGETLAEQRVPDADGLAAVLDLLADLLERREA